MNNVRHRTGAGFAYQRGLYGFGIGIAVLDSGIYPHPDFNSPDNRIRVFRDFVNYRETPYDDNGHGTHIAGIISGNGYLSKGRYMGCLLYTSPAKIIMSENLFLNWYRVLMQSQLS